MHNSRFILFCIFSLSSVFNMSLWLGRLCKHFPRLRHYINHSIPLTWLWPRGIVFAFWIEEWMNVFFFSVCEQAAEFSKSCNLSQQAARQKTIFAKHFEQKQATQLKIFVLPSIHLFTLSFNIVSKLLTFLISIYTSNNKNTKLQQVISYI